MPSNGILYYNINVVIIITFRSKNKKRLSNDQRNFCIKAITQANMSLTETSAAFNIPYSTVTSLYRKYKNFGTVELKKRPCRKTRLSEDDENYIKSMVQQNCCITLRAMQRNLQINRNIDICITSVYRYVKKCKLTKKRINKVVVMLNFFYLKCHCRYAKLPRVDKLSI